MTPARRATLNTLLIFFIALTLFGVPALLIALFNLYTPGLILIPALLVAIWYFNYYDALETRGDFRCKHDTESYEQMD